MRFVPALTILLTSFAAVSAEAQPPSGLAGVWRFQSEVDTRANGSVVQVGPAEGWSGSVVYTADGFVSVNIMPNGRRWTLDTASLADLRATFEDGSAYAGRYEVDPAAGTITHILQTSLDPADEGKRLVRRFTLDGDSLTLSGTFPFKGETLTFTTRWTRVR